MINDELKVLLEAKRKDLIKELTAIDVLLGNNDGNIYLQSNVKNIEGKAEVIEHKIEHKDEFRVDGIKMPSRGESEIWKDYIYKILKLRGTELKTNQIADIIIKANANVAPARAKQVTADKLLELVNDGKVKVTKGASRKIGYIYEVI
jgi:hypothetical protein